MQYVPPDSNLTRTTWLDSWMTVWPRGNLMLGTSCEVKPFFFSFCFTQVNNACSFGANKQAISNYLLLKAECRTKQDTWQRGLFYKRPCGMHMPVFSWLFGLPVLCYVSCLKWSTGTGMQYHKRTLESAKACCIVEMLWGGVKEARSRGSSEALWPE